MRAVRATLRYLTVRDDVIDGDVYIYIHTLDEMVKRGIKYLLRLGFREGLGCRSRINWLMEVNGSGNEGG